MEKRDDGPSGGSLGWLIRRKRGDSVDQSTKHHHQLAKRLSLFDLVAIGVGSTIGAGVYILVGTVATEHTGASLPLSFLVAGIAAALSAFCYAELACRCPSAGSAYHYSYICIGEGVAWLIGWALILEYTLGGSAVARGISPNLALFFGGEDKLPAFLTRHILFGILVDPCAAILVLIMTGLLCIGIKESSVTQAIITITNVCALVFIVIAGTYLGYKTGWSGYELRTGFFPFGVNGFFAGSAAVFFSYVGFDCITSTAEEVKNPQRDMPLGIGISLSVCASLYMLVSAVIVGLVPYNALDPDTPISSAFASHGMKWAEFIITTGAVTALCASLMGAILPQPRILMAMARDGLLPSFFSDINKHTRVPVKSTIITGIFIAVLAFFMDVSQLTGMVSVGTLLAFTMVAISVLILGYIPPVENNDDSVSVASYVNQDEDNNEISKHHPLLYKISQGSQDEVRRRKIATRSISLACVGIVVLASAASSEGLPSIPRVMISGAGGLLLLYGLVVLSHIDQAHARYHFGHSGGYLCPFVPLLPLACILINTYLLINLGSGTWIRVSIWLAIGILIYLTYGRKHSLLNKNNT